MNDVVAYGGYHVTYENIYRNSYFQPLNEILKKSNEWFKQQPGLHNGSTQTIFLGKFLLSLADL